MANLALLERHAEPGRAPSRGDYAFVFAVAVLFGVIVAVPVLMAIWLTAFLWRLVST